jgi:Fur family ferric uptake transcriptional regulator
MNSNTRNIPANERKSLIKERLTEYLEKKGLRKTRERYAVLDEIFSLNKHFDIESLFDYMKSKNHQISRATLYNTINLLVESKLIVKHNYDNNTAIFEKNNEQSEHHHIICNQCGKIIEFSNSKIDSICSSISEKLNFSVQYHLLYLYGTCNECKD